MNIYIKKDVEIRQDVVHKIPRPPNAFMLYANENRKITAQLFPTESNKEISKRLGNSWKSLEADVKNKYFDKAKLIDLEHKKRYPNYVYNPKEARIRKAMREATRDRSIGASPMLPRPNARPNSWIPSHGDHIVLPNFCTNMERTGCNFGISEEGSYIQINPSNQVQHSNWPRYQVTPEAGTGGENYLIVSDSNEQKQPASFLLNHPYSCNQPTWFQELPRKRSLDISQLISLKPDDSAKQVIVSSVEERSCEESNGASGSGGSVLNNNQVSVEVPQNIMEENEQFLVNSSSTSSCPQSYNNKVDSVVKVKIESNETGLTREQIYLPLSEYTFSVPQELLNDDVHCHREYIIKYFMNMPGYEVFDVKGSDEQSFPYVAFNSTFMDRMETNPDFVEQSPNFIPTDVGYIPMFDYNIRDGGMINFQNVKKTRKDQQN